MVRVRILGLWLDRLMHQLRLSTHEFALSAVSKAFVLEITNIAVGHR